MHKCLKARGDTNITQCTEHWLLSAPQHQLRCWGLCVSSTRICSRNPEFNKTCSERTSCNASPDSCSFLKKAPGKGAVGKARSQAQPSLPAGLAGHSCACSPGAHSFTCSQGICSSGTNTRVLPPFLAPGSWITSPAEIPLHNCSEQVLVHLKIALHKNQENEML